MITTRIAGNKLVISDTFGRPCFSIEPSPTEENQAITHGTKPRASHFKYRPKKAKKQGNAWLEKINEKL